MLTTDGLCTVVDRRDVKGVRRGGRVGVGVVGSVEKRAPVANGNTIQHSRLINCSDCTGTIINQLIMDSFAYDVAFLSVIINRRRPLIALTTHNLSNVRECSIQQQDSKFQPCLAKLQEETDYRELEKVAPREARSGEI